MSERVSPLPTDHVFVLQAQESDDRAETCHAGRVEHLSSGEASRFSTTEEFWDFVDSILARINRGLE